MPLSDRARDRDRAGARAGGWATSLVVEAALLEESKLHVDQALGPGVAALPKARLDRV